MTKNAFVVLVGFDEKEQSGETLRAAFDQAHEQPNSRVHVVRMLSELPGALAAAVEHPHAAWREMVDCAAREAHLVLDRQVKARFEEWQKEHQHTKIESVEVHASFTEPADGIVGLADQLDADLVVLGTHGHGRLHRLLFGCTSERVIRHTDRRVLVHHSDAQSP